MHGPALLHIIYKKKMNILPFIYFALYPRFLQTFSLSMELAKSYKVSL